MIQRIQSIYLLLGAIALGAVFLFNSPWVSNAAATYVWFEPALISFVIAAAITAVAAVFMYRDRKQQRKVVVGAQVLTVLLILVLYGGLFLSGELAVRTGGSLNVSKTVMLLMPVVAYLFFLLARRSIDSDIELVKSMDRLR